jgi:hypothetical protein
LKYNKFLRFCSVNFFTGFSEKYPIIYNPARQGFQLFPLFEFFIWISYNSKDAPVAQLDRAWASGAQGCGFKSRQARKKPA